MTNHNCGCRYDCIAIGVLASIVIGIITAFLTFSATISVGNAFLWTALGIAVVYFAITLFATVLLRFGGSGNCICTVIPVLLTGILGTILTSLILLAITFAATSIIGAIITGLLLLFFSLIITSIACIIRCISGCNNAN